MASLLIQLGTHDTKPAATAALGQALAAARAGSQVTVHLYGDGAYLVDESVAKRLTIESNGHPSVWDLWQQVLAAGVTVWVNDRDFAWRGASPDNLIGNPGLVAHDLLVAHLPSFEQVLTY